MKKKIMMLMAVIIFGPMLGFYIIRGAQIGSIPQNGTKRNRKREKC